MAAVHCASDQQLEPHHQMVNLRIKTATSSQDMSDHDSIPICRPAGHPTPSFPETPALVSKIQRPEPPGLLGRQRSPPKSSLKVKATPRPAGMVCLLEPF